MNICYFDTIAGISGDMTLGAMISAGVPKEFLLDHISQLPIGKIFLQTEIVQRSAISAVRVNVREEAHGEHSHHHRHFGDIVGMIRASSLPARVRERAEKIFTVIGSAEAIIHATALDHVHFHEVGAIDSIVDIIGAALCFEYFSIEKFYSSPVKLGSGGTIQTQHGTMPVPTPATLEILKEYPTVLTDIPHELTTPTGAGIIKALSIGNLSMEQFRVEKIGYGSGSREMQQVPNLLRVMIGTVDEHFSQDELVTVEANIDNMNPEIYPFVIEQLLAGGAHDAFLIPVVMKKGRPGILLSALVNRGGLDEVLPIFFAETTTLGVRIQPVERRKLERASRTVETVFGPMAVKVILTNGKERLVPEFEECKKAAMEKNIPLIEVYRAVERGL